MEYQASLLGRDVLQSPLTARLRSLRPLACPGSSAHPDQAWAVALAEGCMPGHCAWMKTME